MSIKMRRCFCKQHAHKKCLKKLTIEQPEHFPDLTNIPSGYIPGKALSETKCLIQISYARRIPIGDILIKVPFPDKQQLHIIYQVRAPRVHRLSVTRFNLCLASMAVIFDQGSRGGWIVSVETGVNGSFELNTTFGWSVFRVAFCMNCSSEAAPIAVANCR